MENNAVSKTVLGHNMLFIRSLIYQVKIKKTLKFSVCSLRLVEVC